MKSILLAATILTGQPYVLDADTIELQHQRIRIQGIDAPELDQICTRSGATYSCGIEARDQLVRYLGSRIVACETSGKDIYNRWLAVCRVDGEGIGAWLVRQGYALAFTRYSYRYIIDEAVARVAGRGMWAGEFVPPWDWRRQQK